MVDSSLENLSAEKLIHLLY